MREEVIEIIAELQDALADIEKVENGSYGFKAAAVRVRKVLLTSSKQLKDVRKEVQEAKNSHD